MIEVWWDNYWMNSKCISCCVCLQSCLILLWPPGLWTVRLLCPWNFPGKNTGVGCHFLLSRSLGSSQPKDRTHISCILYHGGFFTTASPGKPYKWMSLVGIQAYKGVLNAKWLMPAVRPMRRLSRGYSFWVVWLGESFKEKWGLIQTLKGG